MQQLSITSDWKNGTSQTGISLTAYLFQENDIHYAYLPAFDIIGYGYSSKEAWDSLHTTLTEFMNYTAENATLLPELERLGWNINTEDQLPIPPSDLEMHQTNEQLQEIISQSAYRTSSIITQLPSLP